MKLRDAAPAVGVFAVALAWLLLFRPYGFQLEDEGTILSWFDRVAAGQRPYVDFHTGYTPGFFAFGSSVFALFGTSATAMRAVLAVINALTAALLTEATRRVAGLWLAPVPALLWLTFMPVYVGEFAAFNIPYPTWPVTLTWAALALVLLEWTERPRHAHIALAGLLCAAAMWIRPNSGAFALAATTWVVAAFSWQRALGDRIVAVAASVFMAAGVWYAFGFRMTGMDAVVHLLPALALLAMFTVSLSPKVARADAPGAAKSIALLAGAFLLPTLAWTLPLVRELGTKRFLYEVFLVGAGYQDLYFKPHPMPEPFAALVVASLVAVAILGAAVARRQLPPLPTALVAIIAAAAGLVLMLQGALAPEGLVRSVLAQLENASYWMAVTATYGAVAFLYVLQSNDARAHEDGPLRQRALAVVTPLAVMMYAQMFPRSDFMHQISAVPLSAMLACVLLDRVCRWWSPGWWPRVAALAVAASVVGFAGSEKIAGPLEARRSAAPDRSIGERLDVHVEAAAGDELAAFSETVAFLRDRTAESELVWSFPAATGVLFAAGRRNIAPHDYWYPGRPDHAEEQRVLALLEAAPPRFIVTLNKGWNFFSGAPEYFAGLREFVKNNYSLTLSEGRYDVLMRHGAGVDSAADEWASSGDVVGSAHGTLAEVLQPNLERRRQAAWRWMNSVTPEEASAAKLPDNRRDAILLLRALRDGGDMRGAAWAVLGYDSADPRIRSEAVDAMEALGRSYADQRYAFANHLDAALPAFVAPAVARARTLPQVPELQPFARSVLEIAGPQAP